MKQQSNINNHYAKKSLGQNFIVNRNFLLKLDKSLRIDENDVLIEIGPGKGALTEFLVKKKFKKLYLIEKDKLLFKDLEQKYKSSDNITVCNDDALLYDFNYFNLINNNVVILGNLPFNISTKLLTLWLKDDKWPSFFNRMILMFQKEVADRILANHNNKKYGRLSVLVQSRCKVSKLINAPASIFLPKPKVNGTVLLFEPIKAYQNINFFKLEKLLEKAFMSRRKKIKTTLKEYRHHLIDLDIDENLRPENLSISDYCNLTKVID